MHAEANQSEISPGNDVADPTAQPNIQSHVPRSGDRIWVQRHAGMEVPAR